MVLKGRPFSRHKSNPAVLDANPADVIRGQDIFSRAGVLENNEVIGE